MSDRLKKTLLIIGGSFTLIAVVCFITYKINTGAVSNNDAVKEIMIESGSNYYSITSVLKENKLIKSELFYKIYIKLHKPESLQAGVYKLSENMNVSQLIDKLSQKNTYNPDAIRITFQEGINMRKVASIISNNTNNKEEDVYSLLKDQDYLDELIDKYWFLTDEIKNKKIYYPLEGYLFPNTYEFKNKDVTVKEIFATMLNQTDKVLSPYKDKIAESKYTLHEILTLASIVELEVANKDDRDMVACVFYNRLKDNWSLGSDVTTYYAVKVDMGDRDLYQRELDDYNDYNTRCTRMTGKLPVSPICNPSSSSIISSINPASCDSYYFVADKNNKTYFSKNASEHSNIIKTLKDEGLWYVR